MGDPLSGTTHSIKMANGYTYTVQDLAFASWFYGTAPSFGTHKYYSLYGTFKSHAAHC